MLLTGKVGVPAYAGQQYDGSNLRLETAWSDEKMEALAFLGPCSTQTESHFGIPMP